MSELITPYPAGTVGQIRFNEDDPVWYPAVILSVRDYTEWCDENQAEEPIYEVEAAIVASRLTHGIWNHCRFFPAYIEGHHITQCPLHRIPYVEVYGC